MLLEIDKIVMHSLTTDRLVLRPLVSQDLDDLAFLLAQPILMQYITGPSPCL